MSLSLVIYQSIVLLAVSAGGSYVWIMCRTCVIVFFC